MDCISNENVIKAACGDENAFIYLIKAFKPFIIFICQKFPKYTDFNFDDLYQEGLIGLLSAVKTFNPEFKIQFKSYAKICIENNIISALRKRGKSEITENDSELINLKDLQTSKYYDLVMDFNKVFNEKLSDFEKKCFVKYLEGYSYKEISEIVDVNFKSVSNAILRAKNKLKESI